jgi:general secretion pathway protein D
LAYAVTLSGFGTSLPGVAFLVAFGLPDLAMAQDNPQGLAAGQVLNFRDADIRAFIEDVSMMTGRAFIVGPRVTGKVTVISEEPVSPAAVFDVFLSTLQVHGFTVTPTASGAYKIIEESRAAQQAQPLGPEAQGKEDRFVTEIFRLRRVDGPMAMRSVQPIISADGRAIAQAGSDFLILVDYASNMDRLRQIIAQIDADQSITRTMELKNISSTEMAGILNELLGKSRNAEPGSGGAVPRVVPVVASNTLVLRGEPKALAELMETIEDIDSKSAARSSIRVFYLKHAEAAELVSLLQEVSQSLATSGGEAAAGPRRASIAMHEETNALIISAEPDMLLALEQVINQLDIRRAQVLVEAIIVEVSDNAARDLGLQYVLGGGSGSNIPFTATNFSNTAPDILAATGAIAVGEQTSGDSALLDGLQQAAISSLLGVGGFAAGIGGLTNNGTLFGVILTALAEDVQSNVLSTPHIMTMDNELANISVGQEVPITTGEVVGADLVNPFRTVERKDVGVQLEVRPQITEGDTVRLVIRQEVSSILGPVSAASSELIFNKREITTTVMVDDGEIIVLGGLIEDDERISLQKVPFLGDIPGIGRLFRSESRSRAKTNLMVFIRPTIVRDKKTAASVTDRKYDYIRAEQMLRSNDGEARLDSYLNKVLGAGSDDQPQP